MSNENTRNHQFSVDDNQDDEEEGSCRRHHDSLDIKFRHLRSRDQSHAHLKGTSWCTILQLAFQSMGVVYGDIGTSPLYVYASTFQNGIKYNDDILGVLSLIFYTITLIPLVKYVFIVLRANDNGNGGTFALYSLLCRNVKIGLIPSQEEEEDQQVSTYRLELPNKSMKQAWKLKSKLENSRFAKFFLLFATMLGTSMVVGDGVLTPCISVLSAVGGIKEAFPYTMTEGRIVGISVLVLVCLFMVQRFGTDKVGNTFAPIICVWFTLIATIGAYNFIKFDPSVIKAINPRYIFEFFRRNKKDAWISLGGLVLAITGTEALFADVGHFTVRSIQISMSAVTYPALILAYTGQASFLRRHNDYISDTFFKSIPHPMYWPMFIVSVLAAIIASQAYISGTFSIIQQSVALGCFPRVRIVHTSAKYEGQVYIPEVNYLLMLACVAVTLGFRTTTKISNAYGIAVVFVMILTSSFIVLIMITIWKTNILLIIAYVLVIGSVELLYLSSVLYKFDQGGYLPVVFAMVLMTVMFVWNYVHRKKYHYELEHKISLEMLKELSSDANVCRMPGLAIFYSELVHGIPPIFKQYIVNVPALHSVLVFVSIKSLHISKVPSAERFLLRRIKPRDLNMFRCVVRYGYSDGRNEQEPFERILVERLKEFVAEDLFVQECDQAEGGIDDGDSVNEERKPVEEEKTGEEMEREIEVLEKAWRAGVVHLVGEHEVVAREGTWVGKRIVIDYAYNFMKRNLRQTSKVFDIPHKRMLKVGMIYEL